MAKSLRTALVGACLAALALAPSASAAFPGANGKIAFALIQGTQSDIWVMNPDGTDRTNLTNSPAFNIDPAWSPDGRKIAFARATDYTTSCTNCNFEIYVMNADGSQPVNLTNNVNRDEDPAWSPDGTKIVFPSWRVQASPEPFVMNADGSQQVRLTQTANTQGIVPSWSPDGKLILYDRFYAPDSFTTDIWSIHPDGTAATRIIQGAEDSGDNTSPDWSPDGSRFVFSRGFSELWTANPDGSGQTQVSNGGDSAPVWSPDGTKIGFESAGGLWTMNSDGSGRTSLGPGAQPIWQPIPQSYPRPKGASPAVIFLVPAYKPCVGAAANRTHGTPLAFPSCAPPQQTSDSLTVGTPDANGEGAKSVASVIYKVKAAPPADVLITTLITDVRNKAGLTAYTGDVRVNSTVRITDRLNGPSSNEPGTVMDIPLTPATVQCIPTVDTTVGSTCSGATSANAILPGTVSAGKRAIWQIDQISVEDGGADGNVTTTDNTIFLKQGIFVP